jgi:hypothetical protein
VKHKIPNCALDSVKLLAELYDGPKTLGELAVALGQLDDSAGKLYVAQQRMRPTGYGWLTYAKRERKYFLTVAGRERCDHIVSCIYNRKQEPAGLWYVMPWWAAYLYCLGDGVEYPGRRGALLTFFYEQPELFDKTPEGYVQPTTAGLAFAKALAAELEHKAWLIY